MLECKIEYRVLNIDILNSGDALDVLFEHSEFDECDWLLIEYQI